MFAPILETELPARIRSDEVSIAIHKGKCPAYRRRPDFRVETARADRRCGVLDVSPHFNLHFMNQVLRIPNLILDIPRGAKQRAKLTGPPPDERGFVLSFKLMPAKSRSLQTHHHVGAFGGGIGSQRCLINPNNLQTILPETVPARARVTRSDKRARIIPKPYRRHVGQQHHSPY